MKPTTTMLRLMAQDITYNRLVCEAVQAELEYKRAEHALTNYKRSVLNVSPPSDLDIMYKSAVSKYKSKPYVPSNGGFDE